MMRRQGIASGRPLRRLLGTAAALAGMLAGATATVMLAGPARAAEINALVWCDHTDPTFLQPFEQATGIKVNVKDYEGTGTALSLLEQSGPGAWDVFVVDSTDVRRVVSKGLLAPLDAKDFPLNDVPEAVRLDQYHQVGGKLYAVPEKFGYNAIAFDASKVEAKALAGGAVLWDPAYKGRVAIYDYYLPIMTQVAVALGKRPQDLTEADLPAIREKLYAMKANAAVVSDIVTSQTALATGEVDLLIGGGEFAVSGLTAEKPNLQWTLPQDGGVRWQQAVGVFADAKNKDGARTFIQYILSPEGQARLATSSCYWGMPANAKATLTPEQKAILHWDEQPALLARSHPYPAVTDAMDKAMQDVWADFLQR